MSIFKMVSYNIMSGCFSSISQNSKLTKRIELLKKFLGNLNADFVGLIDTFKWKETFSEDELKFGFGYRNVFCIDMDDERVGKNVGLTVLTNLDINNFNIISAHNRNFIETKINDLHIYTIYLDDISEDTRLLQIKSLLQQIKFPAIIHGDLNTFTKSDNGRFSETKNKFIVDIEELLAKFSPILKEMERGEVVELIKQKGFIDSDKEIRATFPTKLFFSRITEPFVRVDYIFRSKEINISNLEVPYTDVCNNTSDHFPILADVNF